MAKYVPHVWSKKETIASDLLNHAENGILDAQNMAEQAQNAVELTAALNLLIVQTNAEIRKLRDRISELEK